MIKKFNANKIRPLKDVKSKKEPRLDRDSVASLEKRIKDREKFQPTNSTDKQSKANDLKLLKAMLVAEKARLSKGKNK